MFNIGGDKVRVVFYYIVGGIINWDNFLEKDLVI